MSNNVGFRLLIKEDELLRVPFIKHVPLDGRTVFLQPYFDRNDKKFKMYVPQVDRLTLIYATPVKSCYYSETKIDPKIDLYLELLDLIIKHYSFNSILRFTEILIKQILHFSVILEKYFVFLKIFEDTGKVLVSDMITIDVEYLFGNIRSLFDQIQYVIRDLWRRNTKVHLPKSFHDMVKRSCDELQDRYSLPDSLADYYVNSKSLFFKCKGIRDDIIHSGKDVDVIFCTDDGFALQKNSLVFSKPLADQFDIWPEEKTKENGLVSVLAIISHLVFELLNNLDKCSTALSKSIPPFPAITNQKLFLRGSYSHHLNNLTEYLEKQWVASS